MISFFCFIRSVFSRRRLEEQLKAIQLEEELRRERKRSDQACWTIITLEALCTRCPRHVPPFSGWAHAKHPLLISIWFHVFQARIAHEQNHIYRMHLLSKLDHKKKLYAPPYTEEQRIVQSDHGRDARTDDRKVYQYFSNSAPYSSADRMQTRLVVPPAIRGVDAFQELDEEPTTSNLVAAYAVSDTSSEYCKRCRNHMKPVVCNYCERRRHNLPFNEEFCLKCSVPLSNLEERENGICQRCRQTDLRCGFCQKHIDVCPKCNAVFCLRCHRRQQTNNTGADRPNQHRERLLLLSPNLKVRGEPRAADQSTKQSQFGTFASDSDSEHDVIIPSQVTRNHDEKPFSTNVPHTSIFHPNARVEEPRLAVNIRNGEIFVEELEDKLAKYARNYSDLRQRKQPLKLSPQNRHSRYSDGDFDAFPVPLMSSTKQSSDTTNPVHHKRANESVAVQRLTRKWEASCVTQLSKVWIQLIFAYDNRYRPFRRTSCPSDQFRNNGSLRSWAPFANNCS